MQQWYKQLKTGDAVQRIAAVRQLLHSNDEKALPILLSALADPDMDVKLEVITALGARQYSAAMLPLLNLLREIPKEHKAMAYFTSCSPLAMAVFSIVKAHPEELTLLLRHEDPAIRAQMAYFVFRNDFHFYAPEEEPLDDDDLPFPGEEIRALLDDDCLEVRKMALLVLAEKADLTSLPVAIGSLPEADASYQSSMLLALDRFCMKIYDGNFREIVPGTLEKLEKAIAICVEDMRQPQALIRLGAVKAMSRTNHPKIRKALRKGLGDVYPRVRAASIEALDNLVFYKGDYRNHAYRFFLNQKNLPLLISALHDPDPTVRLTAVKNSPLVKHERFYETLFHMSGDSDPRVRQEVIDRFTWIIDYEKTDSLRLQVASTLQ